MNLVWTVLAIKAAGKGCLHLRVPLDGLPLFYQILGIRL
jgi:hypothetical protein